MHGRPQNIKCELKIYIPNWSWSVWYGKRMRGVRFSQRCSWTCQVFWRVVLCH